MAKTSDNLTPLMQQYWNIKAGYPGIILFFRLGDFYEMFGDDAVKAAPVLEVVLTQRTGVPMCGVPYFAANSYMRKLINKGFKVAICDQLEEPGASKGIVKRGVTKVITPGTILEDTLIDSRQNNFLMSVVFDEASGSAAFAAADISTGDFFTAETKIEQIDSEISKYNPGEILIARSSLKNAKAAEFMSEIKTPVSELDDSFFGQENSGLLINELFPGGLKSFGIDKKEIVSAVGAVLSYIKETQGQSLHIFSRITFLRNSDFMQLDDVAIKNLELLNSLSNGKTENSLLSAMDRTKTPMGARSMRQWLVQPLFDVVKIENRQNIVRFFIDNPDIRKELSEKFKNISDIERITSRISSQTAGPKEISALKDSLVVISEISEILKSKDALNVSFPDGSKIIEKISATITDEPPVTVKDGNVIKAGVSEALDELRKISIDTKSYISGLEAKERQASGINNLKIGYTSVFGYYIEITKSNIPLAPKHYVRKQTLANCERYITDELKSLEEKILSAQEKTIRLENELFDNLRRDIALFTFDILKISRIIAELDIFCGFAQNALEYDYCRPQMTDSKDLIIEEGRHPVVERILKQGEFVPNDASFDENSRILILTGPNMSGKSTYLRQTALIAIMAQTGSYVPAKSANIGLIDRIFTRIGAGDNLAGGESTFMVEMTETANILNQYTDRSLIILDEVGRGTSTYDGMSIAWAIIEYLADARKTANKGSKILFATHYFELTKLADKLAGVKNFSVDVKEWNGDVVFLHKIKEGSADKSYGIYVAKIAGLPHQIIEKAHKILEKLEAENSDSGKRAESGAQDDLFTSLEPQILVELRKIDQDKLSPIEAFKILREWKDKYK